MTSASAILPNRHVRERRRVSPIPQLRGRAPALLLALLSPLLAGAAEPPPDLPGLLLQKGQITQAEYDRLKPAAERAVQVETEEGFRLLVGDGSWLQIGTLAQFDFARYVDDASDLNDGSEFRRFRPYLMGSFRKDWQFRTSFEVSGGAEVIDAYVSYRGFKPLSITAGNFLQPDSLESMSSDKYNAFMERALPFAFAISRAPGLAVSSSGAHWTAAVGAFGEPPAVEPSGDEGGGVTGRVSWAPWTGDGRALHLGFSAYQRWASQDNGGAGVTSLRFRAKPESSIIAIRLVDTGPIAGAHEYRVFNPELGATWGALWLQGEYVRNQVARRGGPDLDFSGWYAQAMVSLTGERRAYRTDRGTFDGPKPRRELGRDGGWGAWEMGLRLSELDLSDADVDGGRLRDLTFGISLYPNPLMRFSFNAVKVLSVDGGPQAGNEPLALQLRLQLGY